MRVGESRFIAPTFDGGRLLKAAWFELWPGLLQQVACSCYASIHAHAATRGNPRQLLSVLEHHSWRVTVSSGYFLPSPLRAHLHPQCALLPH